MNRNSLVKSVSEKLSTVQIQQLVQFTDMSVFLNTLDACNWTGTTEIEEILKIAKQDMNLAAKLSAIKYLHELLKDAMETSGLLVRATKTIHNDNGDVLTFTADLVTAALPPAKEIPSHVKRNEECPSGKQIDDQKRTGSEGEGSKERRSVQSSKGAPPETIHPGTTSESSGKSVDRGGDNSGTGERPSSSTIGTRRPPIPDYQHLFRGLANPKKGPARGG